MNFFSAAMIVLVPFQSPGPELAMAEEEASKRKASSPSAVPQSKKVKISQPVSESFI